MTDPTEIARVAAGLTRAQREFASGDHVRFARGYKPGEKLVELGILDRQRGTFGDRISRTDLGMAVRDHILREKSGG